jgi:hypothetical protein
MAEIGIPAIGPADNDRVGRLVLALLNADKDQANRVLNELVGDDDAVLGLIDCLLTHLVGALSELYGRDHDAMVQWAVDIITKAQQDGDGL